MTETLPDEPGSIIVARRQLAERQMQLRVIDAYYSMRGMVTREIDEITEFIAEWEAGQVSE